jgi:hypothetical protein
MSDINDAWCRDNSQNKLILLFDWPGINPAQHQIVPSPTIRVSHLPYYYNSEKFGFGGPKAAIEGIKKSWGCHDKTENEKKAEMPPDPKKTRNCSIAYAGGVWGSTLYDPTVRCK